MHTQSRDNSSELQISKSVSFLTKEQASQERELEKFLFLTQNNSEETSRFGVQKEASGPNILVDSFLPPAAGKQEQPRHKYRQKENAIDDYSTVSSVFYPRKLQQKAFKALVLFKMQRIHKNYLLRVARGFLHKRL